MDLTTLRPMLASSAEVSLTDSQHVYEPKYDGIRALIAVDAGMGDVRLTSRLGNDKTSQFSDLVRLLKAFAKRLKASVVLDGKIVALDPAGQPVGFQALQGRIHLTGGTERYLATKVPVAFIAFDILQDGLQDLTQLPLTARRARLERVFENSGNERLRLSEVVPNDGTALYQRAQDEGWEGLIAKKADSRCRPYWRHLHSSLRVNRSWRWCCSSAVEGMN